MRVIARVGAYGPRLSLDSGGFSEIAKHGRWTVEPRVYVAEVRRWSRIIGKLLWAAIQDWMCEPDMLAKTGKSIRDHQLLTIKSLVTLRRLGPELPWTPVLQGWHLDDYLHHLELYRTEAGVDLLAEPIVGVGSVCRRQGLAVGAGIMRGLSRAGLRIHAFGIKTQGLAEYGDRIVSSDSLAWSFAARSQRVRLPGCGHATCGNCFDFAMQWRERLLRDLGEKVTLDRPRQVEMPWFGDGGDPVKDKHGPTQRSRGAATPGQGASLAAGNVAEPQLGPTAHCAERPPSPLCAREVRR